jgi:hypothetical protein
MSWRRAGIGVIALALALALILPLPHVHSVLLGAAENATHAPVFGLVAFAILKVVQGTATRAGRPGIAYVIAFVGSFTLGFIVEVIQFFGPRDASLEDMVTNALGAGGLLAAHASLAATPVGPWSRRVYFSIAAVCAAIVLAPIVLTYAALLARDRQFPVLADFDSALDTQLTARFAVRLAMVEWPPNFARPGDGPALEVAFLEPYGGGFFFREPYPDWRGFRWLSFDVGNPAAEPLVLEVRVDDALHNKQREDRFQEVFKIPPASRVPIRIALGTIRHAPQTRETEMGRITALMFFRKGPGPAGSMYLGTIRLER